MKLMSCLIIQGCVYNNNTIIQIEMRITKRPSLSKITKDSAQKQKQKQKQKPMNMTITSGMFSGKQLKQPKLPPLRPVMRKTSVKFTKNKQQKQRIQTETTGAGGSEMLQSYYQTLDKGWIKPSQYLQDIKETNLIGDDAIQMDNYEIKLNEKMEKNMAKLESLLVLMERWISILKKILQYTVSKKYNTPYLIQQIKFWRELSKKFDQLQYEFNNQKTSQLLVLMKNSLKTKPEYKKSFDQFIRLKDLVIQKTPLLRKYCFSLQQSVVGNVQRLSQSSDIVTSSQYLKRILLAYEMIWDNNQIGKERMEIVFDKMNDAMIGKLIVSPLYPRQLANISSIKQKYAIIDKALSFYSNLIGIIQQHKDANESMKLILQRAEHTRNVLVNLLQIMGYFQFLYKKKQVLQFSKLFSTKIQFNIFDHMYSDQWSTFMDKVNESMESKNYDP